LLAICRAPAVESHTLVAPDTSHQQGLLLLRSRSQASQLPRPAARIKNGGNACHPDSVLGRAAPHRTLASARTAREHNLVTTRLGTNGAEHNMTTLRFCPNGVGASLLAICRAPAVESDTSVAPDTPHQQGLLLLRSAIERGIQQRVPRDRYLLNSTPDHRRYNVPTLL
jgi:hypothetical protein